jgi:hypothetical protein
VFVAMRRARGHRPPGWRRAGTSELSDRMSGNLARAAAAVPALKSLVTHLEPVLERSLH